MTWLWRYAMMFLTAYLLLEVYRVHQQLQAMYYVLNGSCQ